MRKIRIFLSGSVQKNIEKLNIGKKYWENEQETKLINELIPEVELLNPNTITMDKNNREGRFRADLEMLLSSDMVLVDGVGKKGIGIGAEMALAKNWGIPVYTLSPIGSHYRQLDENGVEWVHPFIFELSDMLFENLDEFISYINESYTRGNLYINNSIDVGDTLDRFNSFDGGYDEGYSVVSDFWKHKPAEMVVECAKRLSEEVNGEAIRCLDLGCGTGKNAIYLKNQGFDVYPIDASYYAISEARRNAPNISWKIRDIRKVYNEKITYHAVILTGSLHCMHSKSEVENIISVAKNITCYGGYNVISVFNDTEQDLSGHAKSFCPILLEHDEYLDMYKDWEIISASNVVQEDVHAHNNISHKHSITRILARKNEK